MICTTTADLQFVAIGFLLGVVASALLACVVISLKEPR